jgi:hypothetical protein
MIRTTAAELEGALHERGFKIGTERKWSQGTVIKTAKGWIDKATGKSATPGAGGGPESGAEPEKDADDADDEVAEPTSIADKAKSALAKAPAIAKGLLAKIKGFPADARKLATDRDFRAKTGHAMAAALKRKSLDATKSVVSEVREMKDAGHALKKLALRQKLSKHDKHALKGAAKAIGTTIAGTIALGGIGHVTAVALGTHFVAETLLKSAARAALFAHVMMRGWPIYENDDAAVEEVVERIIEHVMTKLEGLGDMSDDELAAILAVTRDGGQTSADEPEADDDDESDDEESNEEGGVKLSGARDWAPGQKHNRWVPDDLPGD